MKTHRRDDSVRWMGSSEHTACMREITTLDFRLRVKLTGRPTCKTCRKAVKRCGAR